MSPVSAAVHVTAEDLWAFVRDVLVHVGMDEDGAATVASCLVAADLRGVDSHGSRQVPRYARALVSGAIAADVRPQVVSHFGATAQVDAGHGMGHPAAMLAAHTAASLADEHGVGLVTVRNSNHFGAAFPYAQAMAERGCIGFLTTNGPPVMVPFGGARPAICNNPIAWAIPTREPPMIVLDMACSAAARGKIRLAQREGRAIPSDWATDPHGVPTVDPTAALAGFLQPVGGPKGYGLAVVNEILAGALTASPVLSSVPSDVVETDEFRTSMDIGHCMIAISPAAIGDEDAFLDSVEQVRSELASTPPRDGVDAVLLPGDLEHRTHLAREADGIPLAGSTVASFRALVEECALPTGALPASMEAS